MAQTGVRTTVNTDPKSIHAEQKPQLQLLPPIFLTATARCMELGAKKYGKWNFRENKVECQTYIGAMLRHIMQYQDGEDVDPESSQSHLAHVAASAAILLDAEKNGTLINNRPLSKQ